LRTQFHPRAIPAFATAAFFSASAKRLPATKAFALIFGNFPLNTATGMGRPRLIQAQVSGNHHPQTRMKTLPAWRSQRAGQRRRNAGPGMIGPIAGIAECKQF
jgi:hypothetical protein